MRDAHEEIKGIGWAGGQHRRHNMMRAEEGGPWGILYDTQQYVSAMDSNLCLIIDSGLTANDNLTLSRWPSLFTSSSFVNRSISFLTVWQCLMVMG